MYIQRLREMVPPRSFTHLYDISCRLVTLIKDSDTPIQVSEIFNLTVNLKFNNFIFQIFLLFLPEMSVSFTSYIIQIICVFFFSLDPVNTEFLPACAEKNKYVFLSRECKTNLRRICSYSSL